MDSRKFKFVVYASIRTAQLAAFQSTIDTAYYRTIDAAIRAAIRSTVYASFRTAQRASFQSTIDTAYSSTIDAAQ